MALPALPVIGGILAAAFLKKLVVALGFAILTYNGLDKVFSMLYGYFQSGYNSLPSDLLALLDIGGFKTGINILFACASARISMYAYDKFAIGFFGVKP